MSHTVTVAVTLTDKQALLAAAAHLQLTSLGEGRHAMFDKECDGLAFKLDGWHYPIVVDTATGQAHYDNYNQHWGSQQKLDELVQRYSCEVARAQARDSGYSYSEQLLANGDIRVEMEQCLSV